MSSHFLTLEDEKCLVLFLYLVTCYLWFHFCFSDTTVVFEVNLQIQPWFCRPVDGQNWSSPRCSWCKLFLRELIKQTYSYVLMFQFVRVLAHTLLILIILICVLLFILFSIFCACLFSLLYCGVIRIFLFNGFNAVFLSCAGVSSVH